MNGHWHAKEGYVSPFEACSYCKVPIDKFNSVTVTMPGEVPNTRKGFIFHDLTCLVLWLKETHPTQFKGEKK